MTYQTPYPQASFMNPNPGMFIQQPTYQQGPPGPPGSQTLLNFPPSDSSLYQINTFKQPDGTIGTINLTAVDRSTNPKKPYFQANIEFSGTKFRVGLFGKKKKNEADESEEREYYGKIQTMVKKN